MSDTIIKMLVYITKRKKNKVKLTTFDSFHTNDETETIRLG